MKFTLPFTSIMLLALFMQNPALQAMEQPKIPVVSEVKAEEKQVMCSICQEDIKKDVAPIDPDIITATCCNQKFHFDCLNTWVYSADNKTNPCPLCGQQFPAETVQTIFIKRVAKLVEHGENSAKALKRVYLENGEFFFANEEEFKKAWQQQLKNTEAVWQQQLVAKIKIGHIQCTDAYFEHVEQGILLGNNPQEAQNMKKSLDDTRKLQAKHSISGYLKYHCPPLYNIADTVYNPLMYGLAGAGISSLTGYDLKKGLFLGASAAALVKLFAQAKTFNDTENYQQLNNRSWHSPITGFFRSHTLKSFCLYGIIGLSVGEFLGKMPLTASLFTGIGGVSAQRFAT